MEEDLKNIEEFLSKRTLDEIDKFLFDKYIKSMEKVLKAYRQDEKMIDLMAKKLDYYSFCVGGDCPNKCKEHIKEYFRKKVENNG